MDSAFAWQAFIEDVIDLFYVCKVIRDNCTFCWIDTLITNLDDLLFLCHFPFGFHIILMTLLDSLAFIPQIEIVL